MIPKVSVVIPACNCEKFIAETLDSVLSQTFKDYEIIIIDSSNDNTKSILDRYYKDRIRYYFQERKCVASARKLGAKLSQGKYIAFLDADDIWFPDKLISQLKVMDSNSESALLSTDGQSFNQNGIILESMVRRPADIYDSALRNKMLELKFNDSSYLKGDFYKDLLKGNFVFTSSALIRKKCVETVGYFNENLFISDDYDYWLRIAREYPIIYFNKVTAKYRIRIDGLSGKSGGEKELRYHKDDARVYIYNLRTCPKSLRNLVRNRIIDCYSKAAWWALKNNEMNDFRLMSLNLLKFKKTKIKAYLYILFSFFPITVVSYIKKMKYGLTKL